MKIINKHLKKKQNYTRLLNPGTPSDIKGLFAKNNLTFFKKLLNLLKKFKDIYLISRVEITQEGEIYLATMGKRSIFIPFPKKNIGYWALNFLKDHKRYLNYLKEGYIIFDVGAAIGTYSIGAAKIVGNNGKVYAIEPQPKHNLCIRNNAQLNHFENIDVTRIAISNTSLNSVALFVEEDVIGAGHLISGKEISAHTARNSKHIDIFSTSLYEFAIKKKIKKVHMLKITVNGFELDALKSSRELLNNTKHVLIQSADWLNCFNYLNKHNFEINEFSLCDDSVGVLLMTNKNWRIK